jgi:UDP-N-acetylglucosamine 2-epimerase (non-hydrolysing)
MKDVMVVVGTRPEIIKMAPIIRALHKNKISTTFAHCGQHYDYNMSQQFIEELEIPKPDFKYRLKAHSQGMQTARIMVFIEELVKKTSPSIVLVEGDTNGVLATALATVKLGVPVGHVEAGLRSFDLRMPEEYNRKLTDHASAYLFAPTETARNNLKKENVWGTIYVTGNTAIDAVIQHLPIAEKKSRITQEIPFKKFILATAHRAENVDDITVLKNLIDAFENAPLPVVYPMHPRTKKRLKQNGIYGQTKKSKKLLILPPLGYLDFLMLMKKCELIITDSGGIQEEATAPHMRKHVIVTRISTERPEAVQAGYAIVAGTEKYAILETLEKILNCPKELRTGSPYGDGKAAERIVEKIKTDLVS